MIVAYDVSEERVSRIRSLLGQYLHRKQNSLFEGELSKSKFEELKIRIGEVIDPGHDKVLIYCLPNINLIDKVCLGKQTDEERMIV